VSATESIAANDLLLFNHVAREGSFTRAAERLRMPKSTVSRRLAALEQQLGERLLLRTTRKLTLTDFGHGVLEHARQVADSLEAAAALAQHRQLEPSGRLRVSMPADFANLILAPLLARFVARYPAVQIEVDLSPRRVDLIGENFDLAIRMGALTDDATLAARRMALFSSGAYAAPAYLKRQGTPRHPDDLLTHAGLHLLGRDGQPMQWVLSRAADFWSGLPLTRAVANSPELLVNLACAGSGITIVSDHYVQARVAAGQLVRVLPDWDAPPTPAWAVFPGRRLMPARTRVFIDALAEELQDADCQADRPAPERAKKTAPDKKARS